MIAVARSDPQQSSGEEAGQLELPGLKRDIRRASGVTLMSETRTDGPRLESLAARAGVAGLVILSAKVGWDYWIGEGEEVLAWLTIAAELVAVAGLSVAVWNWSSNRRIALLGMALTVAAAIWCGLTMWEKLSSDRADARQAAAEASLPYIAARSELADASVALRREMQQRAPDCRCPQSRREFRLGHAQAMRDLRAAVRDAQERLDAATPEDRLDVVAVLRGFGVELTKLFGFVAFALYDAPARRAAQQPDRPLTPEERSDFGRGLVSLRRDRQGVRKAA